MSLDLVQKSEKKTSLLAVGRLCCLHTLSTATGQNIVCRQGHGEGVAVDVMCWVVV